MQILTASNVTPAFEEGDAGFIIKKNGNDFQLFNLHKELDPNSLTPEQTRQGEILVAFAVAMQVPQIMQVLLDFSKTPELFDPNLINYGTKQ